MLLLLLTLFKQEKCYWADRLSISGNLNSFISCLIFNKLFDFNLICCGVLDTRLSWLLMFKKKTAHDEFFPYTLRKGSSKKIRANWAKRNGFPFAISSISNGKYTCCHFTNIKSAIFRGKTTATLRRRSEIEEFLWKNFDKQLRKQLQ